MDKQEVTDKCHELLNGMVRMFEEDIPVRVIGEYTGTGEDIRVELPDVPGDLRGWNIFIKRIENPKGGSG